MKFIDWCAAIFFLFFTDYAGYSQDYVFRPMISPEGGGWGIISGITQDIQGNMWFGGERLYKYDGKDYSTYLISDIHSICAAKDGLIWAGTSAGLERLDPATGTIKKFNFHPGDSTSIPTDYINVIFQDKAGTIWIGTGEGLSRYNEKKENFSTFRNRAGDPESISDNTVVTLYEDSHGDFWIGTGSTFIPAQTGGLNKLDRTTGKFTKYLHKDNDSTSLIDDRVMAILEDSHGTFWVGTGNNGLHTMDRKKGTFQRFLYDSLKPALLSGPQWTKNVQPQDHISFITEDVTGNIWIGALQGGLTMYNPSTKAVIHYNDRQTVNTSLFSDKMFWKCYNSPDGMLWMNTWEGSLFKVDPSRTRLPFYTLNTVVNDVFEETPDILWIATDKRGMIRKDVKNNTEKFFLHDKNNPNTISSNKVSTLFRDSDGIFWIGTDNGLNRYDTTKDLFTSYHRVAGDPGKLPTDTIIFIRESKDKLLWLATFGLGLTSFDRQTGKFTTYQHYDVDTTSISTNVITYILEDNKQRLWIGAWFGGGVNLMNRQTGKFTNYLAGSNVTQVYQDRSGTVWVSAINGLFRYNETENKFSHFVNPLTGKNFINIMMLTEDRKNNLWVRTRNEIIRINEGRDHLKMLGKSFGVGSLGNTFGVSMTGSKGNVVFGDQSGYFSFFPEQVLDKIPIPLLLLTELQMKNQVISPGKTTILNKSLSEAQELSFRYNQNIFSIAFKVIDYSEENASTVLMMLENYDKNWRVAPSDGVCQFYNVPPGEYVFRLKINVAPDKAVEKSIRIIIHPPWWKTWWAYVLYIIVFIAGLWAFIRYRSAALRKENIILEEKVSERTTELKHSLEDLRATQAQLIQAEKMASLGQLTAGIAHEIQNPLNFVNNFSEINNELIEELKREQESSLDQELLNDLYTNNEKIILHGKRADSIVKGMLEHSRQGSGQKEPTDINALAEEFLKLAYHGMRAKDKDPIAIGFNVTMKTDFDNSIDNINIMSQDIGRVLLNLYNNAFYATHEKQKTTGNEYQPVVTVSTKKSNGNIEIKVTDNGNGIPRDIVDKIFQPFFTTKPTGRGTGLGLSLAYDIVKAHGGEIKVETKEGKGTEFIILLPV